MKASPAFTDRLAKDFAGPKDEIAALETFFRKG
jgi:hypothetical protein